MALVGTVLPAILILALTLVAAIHPRLQGILFAAAGLILFTVTMTLMPRVKLNLRAASSRLATAM
jgi:uncharacterized membrane protein YccC